MYGVVVSVFVCAAFTVPGSALPSQQSQDAQETSQDPPQPNLYPVIGILAQELRNKMNNATGYKYNSYVAASYVKYMESGGARVVPIMINQTEEYYQGLMDVVNGIVFPGGAASFRSPESGYGRAGSILYDLIRKLHSERGEEIPLIAVCLGFEMLMYLDAGKVNPLSRCNASSVADPLYLRPEYNETSLLGGAPPDVLQTLTTSNSTSNFHKYCVTPQKFLDLGLENNYTLVSTSYDLNGTEYVSTVEHRTLPIYGTQWHPEKNMFEWAFESIPHTREAVRAAQYVVNEFVDRARYNSPRYDSTAEEHYPLIYNYQPTYVRKLYKSSFQQVYLFN